MKRFLIERRPYDDDDCYYIDLKNDLFDINKKAFFGLGLLLTGLAIYSLKRFKFIK